MKSLTLATLYRAYDSTDNLGVDHIIDPGSIKPLQIDGCDIQFLLDIIYRHCEFVVLAERVWRLRFFQDGAYTQTIYVSFASCEASAEHIISRLNEQCFERISRIVPSARKLVKAVFIETSQFEPTAEVIHYASFLVRNTSSLELDTLERHSDRFLHVDGRGTVLLSTDTKYLYMLERQVVLLALAKAYLLAASDIVSELGYCCEDIESLRKLYKQAVTFNAKSYFTCPVKVNRHDAYTLWQGIRKSMPIDDINQEIVQQVQSIHRILSEEEEAKQTENERRINAKLGWLGIGIGILSLVSLFEITPDKVVGFVSSWWHLFF